MSNTQNIDIFSDTNVEGKYKGTPAVHVNLGITEHANTIALCDIIESRMINDTNKHGKFLHPKSNRWTHLVFNGEAMIHQDTIVSIIKELQSRNNRPAKITIETDGSYPIEDEFKFFFLGETCDYLDPTYGPIKRRIELFWSINSPNNNHIDEYKSLSDAGQLKFTNPTNWDDVHTMASYGFDIWVKSQSHKETIKNGFYVL